MISYLRKSSQFTSLFSKQKSIFADYSQTGSVAFHKSVLATHTQNKQPSQNSEHLYPSLRKKIIKTIQSYSCSEKKISEFSTDPSQIAKSVLLCYFTEGIWIPQYLCNQKRFEEIPNTFYKKLANKGQKQSNINCQTLDNQQKYKTNYKKIHFCPTYTITRDIFYKIQNSSNYVLITGQYGAGKTHSFLLYKILSEMIFSYKYLCYCNNQHISQQINTDIPKAIYLNIDLSSLKSIYYFQKTIMDQCYELNDREQKINLSSQPSLKTIYKQQMGIKLIILFDQINEPAKLLRIIKNSTKDQTQSRNSFQQFNKFLQNLLFNNHFQQYLYLSSLNIQRYLLRDLKLMGRTTHASIPIKRIMYPTKLSQNKASSDLYQFIIVYLQQQIYLQKRKQNKNEDLSLNQLKFLDAVRKQLFDIMKQHEYLAILPISINRYFQTYSNEILNNLYKSFQDNKLNQSLILLLNNIETATQLQYQLKIDQFLNKQGQSNEQKKQKELMLITLLLQTQQRLKQIQLLEEQLNYIKILYKQNHLSQHQLRIESLTQKILKMSNYISISNQSNSTRYKFSSIPAQLFTYQQIQNVFKFNVNPIILMRILSNKKQVFFTAFLQANSPILKHIKRQSYGSFIQSVFIDTLSKGGTDLKYSIECKQKEFPKKVNYTQIKNINNKLLGFFSIPKANQPDFRKFYFLQSFKTHIKIIQETNYKSQWHLLLPLINRSTQNQKRVILRGVHQIDINYWAKLMDFCLVKFEEINEHKKKYRLRIKACDITISMKKARLKIEQILMEIFNLMDLYCNQLTIDGKKYQVEVDYIVFAPQSIDKDWQQYFKGYIANLQKSLNDKQQSNTSKSQINKLKQKIQRWKSLQFINFQNKIGKSFEILLKEDKNDPFSKKKQVLFRSFSVVSFLYDSQIENSEFARIGLNKKILDKYRAEYEKDPTIGQD